MQRHGDEYVSDITEFEAMYKKHFASLCNKAFSLIRDKDTSKDIVQTVFFKLWKTKELFFQARSKEAYLYQAVVNESLNHLRRNKIRSAFIESILSPGNSSDDPEQSIRYRELRATLSTVIKSLPARCKEVFLLSRQEGMNYAQISQKLHISINTVEKHMVKALRAFKNALPGVFVLLVKIFS